MEVFQSFNPRTKAWVKYEKMKNGRTKIVNVKQKNPGTPFAGVTKK